MQKGSLEMSDYAWLLILILAYITFRPYTQKAIKWLLAPKDVKEGDEALKEHFQSRAKVDANTIRGSQTTEPEPIPEEKADVTASGTKAATNGQVSNRKVKGANATKSEPETLDDWDDEPARKPVEGDKTDVLAWLDKWDK